MADASIPVDLLNPGQVFACLGFLEAAEVLLGDAEGGFSWEKGSPRGTFHLRAAGQNDPVKDLLSWLASADLSVATPSGWKPPDKYIRGKPVPVEMPPSVNPDGLPMKEPDLNSLPVQIGSVGSADDRALDLTSWCDASSRGYFKLYSGNRSAFSIAQAVVHGVHKKRRKGQNIGDVEFSGIEQLWDTDRDARDALTRDPLGTLTAMGGSFNFDPRGAWTALDAGYSLNDHKHPVAASPVVEIMAAIGLEHARPVQEKGRLVRYAVWRGDRRGALPPLAARAALAGCDAFADLRRFRFTLAMSGKNSIVTFAEEEPSL